MARIGDILLNEGTINEVQLNEALVAQKSKYKTLRLGEVLVELKYSTEMDILLALSKSLKLDIVHFSHIKLSTEILRMIPKSLAIKHLLIPIKIDGNKLVIAMADPLDYYALEDIKSIVTKTIVIKLALKSEILSAIERGYKELDTRDVTKRITDSIKSEIVFPELTINDSDAPIVALINSFLLKAESVNASDIHIEPFENNIQIRLRIDGQLLDYATLPNTSELQISNRIKVLSNLNIAERRLPQDGHFKLKLENIIFNVRVSIFPTIFGEKIVLRFLNQDIHLENSDMFGMNKDNYNKVKRMLDIPYGLIYLTGPTGSGKTTTLYLMLEYLRNKKINISTIEDPVERNIERVNQTQINNQAGFTFSRGLRSLLRQDPDVIMVGETRDSETAKISVSAAITGHLVLSTLHTNDAASSIIRLEDMGIEPYMVGNSLVGIVAQRLTKKICPYCKEEYILEGYERIASGLTKGFRGKGCTACNNTGYRGRLAVHEVLLLNTQLKNLISENKSMEIVYRYLTDSGFKTLKENLIEEIRLGNTTVNELLRLNCSLDELD